MKSTSLPERFTIANCEHTDCKDQRLVMVYFLFRRLHVCDCWRFAEDNLTPSICQSVNLICKQTDWEKLRETRDVCARVLWLVLWFVAWQCDIQYRALTVSWGLERLRLLQRPDTYATLYRVELKAYLEQLVKWHIFSCALFLWQRQHVFLSSLFLVFILCPVSAYVTCCSFHFFSSLWKLTLQILK